MAVQQQYTSGATAPLVRRMVCCPKVEPSTAFARAMRVLSELLYREEQDPVIGRQQHEDTWVLTQGKNRVVVTLHMARPDYSPCLVDVSYKNDSSLLVRIAEKAFTFCEAKGTKSETRHHTATVVGVTKRSGLVKFVTTRDNHHGEPSSYWVVIEPET